MAVYSVRSDRPFIVTKPLKYKVSENPEVKEIREFMRTHRLKVALDESGEAVVVAEKLE